MAWHLFKPHGLKMPAVKAKRADEMGAHADQEEPASAYPGTQHIDATQKDILGVSLLVYSPKTILFK